MAAPTRQIQRHLNPEFLDYEKARILCYLEIFNRTPIQRPLSKIRSLFQVLLSMVLGWRQVGRSHAHFLLEILKKDVRKTGWVFRKVFAKDKTPPKSIQYVSIMEGAPPLRQRDVQRLKSLHNKFKGERIFLMGNGPSLNQTPLHLLKDEYTFAVNRIDLLFDRIDWRPTFYSAFDLRVVPDCADIIRSLDIPYKLFATIHFDTLGDADNHYWYRDNSRADGLENRFEPEAIYTGFGGGGSITHNIIQLAYFMGFDPIYLIGVDASYKVLPSVRQTGPDKFGDGILLNLESTQDDDPNHFDPRYFGKGKKWHNPNVPRMIEGYGDIRRCVERRGRHIYNATVGGKLEVFERVDIHSLF